MSAFVIRHPTEADHPALMRLIRALNAYEDPISHDRDVGEGAAAASLAALLRRIADGGVAFVAEADSELFGYLFCVIEDAPPFVRPAHRRVAVISDAFVAEAWRGLGVFRAMLAKADAHARAAGCRRMLIGVLSGNDRTERIYRAAGFRPYALELVRDLDPGP